MFQYVFISSNVAGALTLYQQIDHELAIEHQNFIIENSSAKLVITAENLEEHIATADTYDDSEVNLACPEDLSYVLYTSGTTSTPKGCLLAYEGLAQAIFLLSWYTFEAHGPPVRYLAVACRSICSLSVYATY